MVGGISRKAINKLSDKQIQAFVRRTKIGQSTHKKLFDGAGMYLTITPAGEPVWRLRYRLGRKDKTYAIGRLDDKSLAEARMLRDEARMLISAGRDPVMERRLARIEATAATDQTFALLADEWLEKQKKGWSDTHYVKSKRALERDVLPRLGKLPVHAIRSVMVSSVIEAVVKRGARDTAAKILQHVRSIFALGQARGLVDSNPADPVHTVLPAPEKQRHHPALLTFPALGDVLRRAEIAAHRQTRRARDCGPGPRPRPVCVSPGQARGLLRDNPAARIPSVVPR